MRAWNLSALLVLALRARCALGQAAADDVVEADDAGAGLQVAVSAKFPQAEIFGVKLINGHATEAVVTVANGEADAVSVAFIGGSLMADRGGAVLRNLTVQRYASDIPAGASRDLGYRFATEMHPQDVRLHLIAVVKDANDAYYTLSAYNETVSVVEAPLSIFDPQIVFLYLVLAAVFAGTVYFIYTTWITTLFPQQRRGGKGGERAKRSSTGTKKVDPSDQVAGADGPAVTSGAKAAYDESWIPPQHLQRPEARRVRSGTPKSKKG